MVLTPKSLFSMALVAVSCFASVQFAWEAKCCPFCNAQGQTLSENIDSMDIAVFADLASQGAESENKAKFKVVKVLKGEEHISVGALIEATYFRDARPGARFLLLATDTVHPLWTTPMTLTERSETYLREIMDLPKAGPKRLAYFMKRLADAETLLSNDAYDEFARAPYEDVRGLKSEMDPAAIAEWVADKDTPANHRKLFFTMLGVCGGEEHRELLERVLRSDDRVEKRSLDAAIGCYLTLFKEPALSEVEDLFLKNKNAEYADTYASLMAIRFLGTESDIIPQKRLIQSLRILLSNPDLADLVIPDLARWEDWDSMDRLVELFKDPRANYTRVPVVNFLRICPLPRAKEYLSELQKIDPKSVERAIQTMPGLPTQKKSASATDTDEPIVVHTLPEEGPAGTPATSTGTLASTGTPSNLTGIGRTTNPAITGTSAKTPDASKTTSNGGAVSALATQEAATISSTNPGDPTEFARLEKDPTRLNPIYALSVTWGVVGLLGAANWGLIRGLKSI